MGSVGDVRAQSRGRWMVVSGSLFLAGACRQGRRTRRAWTADRHMAGRFSEAVASAHAARFWGAAAVPA